MSTLFVLFLVAVAAVAAAPLPLTQTVVISWTAGQTSASLSTCVASPSAVLNNGAAQALVTVTLVDANGNAVSGKSVSLASNRTGGVDTVSPASGLSSAGGGTVTFHVSSSAAGTATFTATDVTDGAVLAEQAHVTFTSVSASMSTVAVSPASVVANGMATATVTVVLKDSSGALVVGRTVAVAARQGVDLVTPAVVATDSNGQAVFSVSSQTAGVAQVVATDTTDSLVLGQAPSITFVAGAVSSATSGCTPATATVVAGTTQVVTVTVEDVNGNAVAGRSVSLASSRPSGGGETEPAGQVTTNAQGQALFTVSNTQAGSTTYTAVDSALGALAYTSVVSYVAGAEVASSPVVLDTQAPFSAGSTVAVVVVFAQDQYGNPLAGKTATLSSSRNFQSPCGAPGEPFCVVDMISSGSPDPSGANGQIAFTVTTNTVGTASYTAVLTN
jgi:hypothetical protein